ncbi:MAG: hypothetical protein COA41_12425 [Sphingopyxis sp.]|nr:MAG: hypothetical protein COA41_12425 [Sphingopyxis sp.]|tara:strand:- start:605 stop:976 length:372 start_codon:yes stop_codon:yes gene_type:complete
MTEEVFDNVDSTIPGRLNSMEQEVHTLKYRMDRNDNERLPARVGTLESSVDYLVSVADTAKNTHTEVIGIKASVRTVSRVMVVLFSLLTLAVAAAGVAVTYASLAPKLDAIIIDKSPAPEADE